VTLLNVRYIKKISLSIYLSIFRPASTSGTLSASALSHYTPWNCCATMAWAKTRWDTSTRPSSSPSCGMHHRHGGVLPVWPISNVSEHLYDVLSGLVCTAPTIPRRSNWLLTWMTISSRTFLTILTAFCTKFLADKTDHAYNLRSPLGFTIWITQTVYCYFWAYPSFLLFIFILFLHFLVVGSVR